MISVPTISVIVPSYNQGHFLSECLDSILVQQYPALELIVMDGGSNDQSIDIIRDYSRQLNYWQSEPDGGQSAAINAGAARAHGDIVAWLNSDDLYHENALWAVARAWSKHPGRGLYIGNGFRLNDETKQLTRHVNRHMAFNRRALREGLDYILQPSAFFNLADWRAVQGLDERLQFCMDWDILIRIADRSAVVLINEFLSKSREYADTKTASGAFRRVDELLRMVKAHTGQEMTIGGSIYAIWTLLDERVSGGAGDAFRNHIYQALVDAQQRLGSLGAFRDGSPDFSDPGDATYLPIPAADSPRPPAPTGTVWPMMTVIIVSSNQAEFLERSLKSVIDQAYPRLELIVMDSGSTDDSLAIIERYANVLTHWQSISDDEVAHAMIETVDQGTGEIVVWISAADMLADGALDMIGRAFASDPQLDLAYGDAMLIDTHDAPASIDRGDYTTQLCFGELPDGDRDRGDRHRLFQPMVGVRRGLIDQSTSETNLHRFTLDANWFLRFGNRITTRKIDNVLLFKRVI